MDTNAPPFEESPVRFAIQGFFSMTVTTADTLDTTDAWAATARRFMSITALCLGLAATVHAAGWQDAGTFAGTRWRHTTTQLGDGRVFVAGGLVGAMPRATTQVHDTTTDGWIDGPDLPGPRADHTATPLRDGTILIAGGINGSASISSTLTFDPQTAVFTPADPMALRRRQHTATLLKDGRVLVAGGRGTAGQEALASAEIYDPATRTWDSTGSMPGQGKRQHTATRLLDGRVLVAGGQDNGESPTHTTALWSPETGTWKAAAPLPNGRRLNHTATLLADGRVFIAGGSRGNDTLATALLYDPALDAWMETSSSMIAARDRHTATLLPDGRVLLTGGEAGGEPIADTEVFDPGTGLFSALTPLGEGRSGHGALLLHTGEVLVTGGAGVGGSIASAERLGITLPANVPATRRPLLAGASPQPVGPDGVLALSGQRLTGDSEGSSGSTSQSAADTPLLRLERAADGSVIWLPAAQSTATSFATRPLQAHPDLKAGLHHATLYVAGMASNPLPIHIQGEGAPTAPTGVSALPGNAQVTVTWDPPEASDVPAESYTVTAEPGGASCTVPAPATRCTVTGLTNGTTYTFTVTAHNAGGSSSAPPTAGVVPAPRDGGQAGAVQAVPTLSDWCTLLLAALMLLAGLRMARIS